MIGRYARRRHNRADALPYRTLTIQELAALPIPDLLAPAAHVWLWTTNAMIPHAYALISAWGLHPLAPVTWIKPSGFGAWFAHTTEHMIMAYASRCIFPLARYRPTHFYATRPRRHSRKPAAAYDLIESISPGPRLELFARPPYRPGWAVWGNE